MGLAQLRTTDEVLAGLLKDPEFRARWERTALARAVAITVIAYRADKGMSQSALAKRLGVAQPAVARLESGEHNPSIETLARLARALDMEFAIDVVPDGRPPRLVTKRARTGGAIGAGQLEDCTILVAAS